jgi:DNA-binding transcriptional MerR regulator
VRYRVEQLAAACEVSVDTVRYYQSRNLLPQPEREGRVAWYDEIHAERIRRIRHLQRKGLTLEAIGRVVRGELADADADLAAAVAEARGEVGEDRRSLDLEDFAATSGVPASLIQAVEREGIRIGRPVDGQMRYTPADTELVRTALRLLEFGLPLGDLLGLARDADGGGPGHAEGPPGARGPPPVDLFDQHVRRPIQDTSGDDPVAAAQMVEAFRELLPAVTALVSNHFRRVVLEAAEARIET